jgi:hypothetical protein
MFCRRVQWHSVYAFATVLTARENMGNVPWFPQAVRIAFSALVIVVFGAIGILVGAEKPFHVLGDWAGIRGGLAYGGGSGASGGAVPEVPVPPDTELTFQTSSAEGALQRYESRISPAGLTAFYAQEMPRQGWEADREFDAARVRADLPPTVLAFKAPQTHCIIGLEEKDSFTTAVTVLVVGDARRGGGPL